MPTTDDRPRAPLWLVVAIVCAGQFIVVLDVSVVNVALPSMRDGLDMSATGLQWIVNAYTLTFAGLLLLGGRAGDLYGRKRVFVAGLGLFSVASLAGGLAQEPWQLIAARAAQGVGAAILAPSTLTILMSSVPEGPRRSRAIATWTAVGGAGGATGSLVGGVLTDLISWRWVLLVNVPVGAIVLLGAILYLSESRVGGDRRLDIPGAVLATAGLAAVAFGVVETESVGWVALESLGPLVAGLAMLAGFVWLQARAPQPLMPLRLFAVRSVAAANSAMFLCGAALVASWYFLSLYMQNSLGFTPLQTGLGFIPLSGMVIVGSKTAPLAMDRVGARRAALTGVTIAALGYLWQSGIEADGHYVTSVLVPGVVIMFGVGFLATPIASLATAGADPSDQGLVSGILTTARTMGGSLGLAVLATIAASRSAGATSPEALASGYALAFEAGVGILVVCGVMMLVWMPRDSPVAAPA